MRTYGSDLCDGGRRQRRQRGRPVRREAAAAAAAGATCAAGGCTSDGVAGSAPLMTIESERSASSAETPLAPARRLKRSDSKPVRSPRNSATWRTQHTQSEKRARQN
eukprot:1644414-Prymnesium_polylepis.1